MIGRRDAFNVVMIGEPFVGKTTLAEALRDVRLDGTYHPTMGASLVKVPFPPGSHQEGNWFSIWDTAGAEKYKSLAPVYYRDSHAAIVVFDVANQDSLNAVETWVKLYRSVVGDVPEIILIGNKTDLARVVTREEVEEVCEKNRIHQYLECSAKTHEGVPEVLPVLYKVLEDCLLVKSEVQRAPEKKGGCC